MTNFHVNGFLIDIVKLSYKELNKLILNKLTDYYQSSVITFHDDNENSFIYVNGNEPYMLVAHTDTVHKETVKEIFVTKSLSDVTYSFLSSPQGIGGDDRNGIAIIFALLEAGLRPSLLFPSGEEIGTKGSKTFTELTPELPNVNLIIQFDRRNNTEVTRYADDNDELIKEIIALGYTEVNGSFSDISVVCPKYLISGVNVSASFFNEHTSHESVDLRGMRLTVDKFIKFLQTDVVKRLFVYKPKTYISSGYQQTSLFDDNDAFVAHYTKYKSLSTLKSHTHVEDYSVRSCSQCLTYGGNLHPIAESGGDEMICDECLVSFPDSFLCPQCGEFNTIDSFSEIVFDFRREVINITCVGCLNQIDGDSILTKDTIDKMMNVLMMTSAAIDKEEDK